MTDSLPNHWNIRSGHHWTNWHDNIERQVTQLVEAWNEEPGELSLEAYNETTEGLQTLIDQAVRHNSQIRALGRGWSFSPVAATDDILLDTKPLNFVFPISEGMVHSSWSGDQSNLFLAQCGTQIARLNELLSSRNKALPTSGASNGQTIAGAISTGTHGAAIDVGSMQDFVAGLHIVAGPDRHIWLERQSDPVLSDNIGNRLGGAEVIRDDELFDAALVSFGSFGLIHGLLLDVEDNYYLNATRNEVQLDGGWWKAIEQLDFQDVELPGRGAGRPFHFEVLFSTVEPDDAIVTVMHKSREPFEDANPVPDGDRIVPGDSALEVVSFFTDVAGSLNEVLNRIGEEYYPKYTDIAGRPGEMFPDPGTRAGAASVGEGALLAGAEGGAASAGIGVPLGEVRNTVRIMRQQLDEYPTQALIVARYVRGTDATLGFTRFQDHTCVVEFNGPDSRSSRRYLESVWNRLREQEIPHTIHWGKVQDIDGDDVIRMYGQGRINSWIEARKSILESGQVREVFTNEWLEQVGLAQ